METAHTPDQPYCDDIDCWCHCTVTYHATVVATQEATRDQINQAYEFFALNHAASLPQEVAS